MVIKYTDTQKQMMKDVNINNIRDLMDNLIYIKEDEGEINNVLARNYDVEVNEEELDAGNKKIFYLK